MAGFTIKQKWKFIIATVILVLVTCVWKHSLSKIKCLKYGSKTNGSSFGKQRCHEYGKHSIKNNSDINHFSTEKKYKILYWTPYYKFEDYNFGTGRDVFTKSCGANYHCEATSNRNDLDSSDVILFHSWHLMEMGLPPRRTPNQIYVFQTMEPPLNDHKFDPGKFHDVFNLTMTYRTDSDIYTPYFSFRKIGNSKQGSAKQDLYDVHKQKKKAVCWFVSHCLTISKREAYVKELKKYIQVDIYGKCGKKGTCKKKDKRCLGKRISECYFYLSFENILCKDYMTEKVKNPIRYNAVPIVRGLARYDVLMPNHSHINVKKFKSPKHLAQYLHGLINDKHRYLKYFEWKRHYEFASRPRRLCHLCKYLMDNPGFQSVYHNFTEFWWPPNQCELNQVKHNKMASIL